MFTGIITHIGIVDEINFSSKKDCVLVILVNQKITRKLDIGCSIACDGICLTLTKKVKNKFYFHASKETCDKTTLQKWFVGKKINLEFALKLGDEFGGHIVSGHVDGRAKIKAIKPIKSSTIINFELANSSKDLAKFIAKKGSICINGISLTINEATKLGFSVNIIEHTFKNTNLLQAKIGDAVNVEIDLIARYIQRQIDLKPIGK